ncbi:hypothetical protein [Olsenella sp. GAM18]|uniref:hypothetical protein n=1 Tax=Paratractidigestivibacter faecalis TaxID=2292441 RepID=UPI0011BAA8A3
MSRNLTRRGFLKLCWLSLAFLLMPKEGIAYERDDHDDITEEILFGRSNPVFDRDKTDAKKCLECAVYLCLDQSKSDGANDLSILKDYGVDDVPELNQIALTGVFGGSHDKYTHMGWHYDYSGISISALGEPWEKRWELRKKLLLNSVNKVFGFGPVSSFRINVLGYTKGTRVDAFAELLYYVHVLGDYEDKIKANIDKEKYKMDLLAIPFATREASRRNRDFFFDLHESLETLFDSSEDRNSYKSLSDTLGSIAQVARSRPAVSSKTGAENFRKDVMKTKRALKKYVPQLLAQEDFFSQVFG